MELHDSITRDNIKHLMTVFYQKAILDEELSPFFIDELGDDVTSEEWEEHIELLADFWRAVLLNEGPYWGNASGAHFSMTGLKRETFMQWIKLFSATADEVYVPEISDQFKEKGVLLSEQFMADLTI